MSPNGAAEAHDTRGERGVGNCVSDYNVSQSKTMRMVIFSIVHGGNVPCGILQGLGLNLWDLLIAGLFPCLMDRYHL